MRRKISEGFKIRQGFENSIRPGQKIPLDWDIRDNTFVRRSARDDTFTMSLDDDFTAHAAFAFSENAPSGKNDVYPSHLEDILEALKGLSDSVYEISDEQRLQYAADGAKIIARQISSIINKNIENGEYPLEARKAKIVVYRTPSSSNHVNEFADALRTEIESRITSDRKTIRQEKATLKILKLLEERYPDKNSPGRRGWAEFEGLIKSGKHEQALAYIEKRRDRVLNAEIVNNAQREFWGAITNIINKEMKLKYGGVAAGVTAPFSKISVDTDPEIRADRTLRDQIDKKLRSLGARENSSGDLTLDLSTIDVESMRKISDPDITESEILARIPRKKAGPVELAGFISASEIIEKFEKDLRKNLPNWQKRMREKGKSSFSISMVPAQSRRHVEKFMSVDSSVLEKGDHFAIIVDDNIESGITLREMRRAFKRLESAAVPPIEIFGAPLLMIRSSASADESAYSGRRGSHRDKSLAPQLSNIPDDSALYLAVMERLEAISSSKSADPKTSTP